MAIDNFKSGARRPLTNQMMLRGGVAMGQTLTGSIALSKQSSQFLGLDPGGANRNVDLPPVEDGLVFYIVNTADAAENLVVRAAGPVTVATLNQNEAAWFVSDGQTWSHGGIYTIALT